MRSISRRRAATFWLAVAFILGATPDPGRAAPHRPDFKVVCLCYCMSSPNDVRVYSLDAPGGDPAQCRKLNGLSCQAGDTSSKLSECHASTREASSMPLPGRQAAPPVAVPKRPSPKRERGGGPPIRSGGARGSAP